MGHAGRDDRVAGAVGAGEVRFPEPAGAAQVSRVERFRTQRLEGPYRYVWTDAAFANVRTASQVISEAVEPAIVVRAVASGKCWSSMTARLDRAAGLLLHADAAPTMLV